MTKIQCTDEVWNPITGFPDYLVNKQGQVKSLKANKLLRPIERKGKGHLYVFLYKGSRAERSKKYIHHLVLEAFAGNCPEGLQCRHLDGNPKNNNLENLVWGTALENARDRQIHGTQARGEQCSLSKLTSSQVLEIRSRWGKETSRKLAAEFGVSHTTIRRAALAVKWSHI